MDGGKDARLCEEARTWKMMYSKQAQLVLYKYPSNILPGSGGRYTGWLAVLVPQWALGYRTSSRAYFEPL